MRIVLVFILVTCWATAVCQVRGPLDSLTIARSTFIGLVTVNKQVGDKIYGSLRIGFKGGKCLDRSVTVKVYGAEFYFEDGETYLIYAGREEQCLWYVDRKCRVIKDENADKDIQLLLNTLPCYDQKVKDEMAATACHRIFTPVCGCNNVTYGNECEALKNGIVVFSIGECKTDSK